MAPGASSYRHLYRHSAGEHLVHPRRHGARHLAGPGPVHVSGGRQVGVAEGTGHDGQLDATFDEQGGVGMAEVVEPLAGEPRGLEGLLEGVSHVHSIERTAHGRREHEVMVSPLRSRCEALTGLLGPLLTERGQDLDREPQGSSGAVGLGLGE